MDDDGPGPDGAQGSGAGGGDDAAPGTTGPPAANPSPVGPVADTPEKRGPSLPRLVVLVAAVVAVVALVVSIVQATGTNDPFSPGDGSATITWTSVGGNGNRPQPFGGTIEGLPVSGVATVDLSAIEGDGLSPLATPPFRIHIFEIKGAFDGKGFTLGVYVQYQQSPLSTTQPPALPTFDVVGSYGRQPVHAVLTAPPSSPSNPESVSASTPVLFNGTIGSLKVSGRITAPTKHGKDNSAHATFTVK